MPNPQYSDVAPSRESSGSTKSAYPSEKKTNQANVKPTLEHLDEKDLKTPNVPGGFKDVKEFLG